MKIQTENKLKKIFLIASLVFMVSLPLTIYAAGVDIPCRPSDQNGGNDLFSCINQLYKYALVICSIAAVFMIMLAGYMYIFSGGDSKKVGTAKSFISTSLLGLVVLLAGFLLLKQINPNLLVIKSITPQQIGQRDWFTIQAEDGFIASGGGAGGQQGGPVMTTCPGGQLVDIPRSEFPQYDNNKTCPNVLEALRRLKAAAAAAGVQFQVNDSYGQGHDSSCHRISGTCVDISKLGSTSWDQLCAVVNSVGSFRILNETGQDTPACGAYCAKCRSTAAHLHLNLK
jgi:hypothetical protein